MTDHYHLEFFAQLDQPLIPKDHTSIGEDISWIQFFQRLTRPKLLYFAIASTLSCP